MQSSRFIAALAMLLGICVFTSQASACYDPALGRWLTCDPINQVGGDAFANVVPTPGRFLSQNLDSQLDIIEAENSPVVLDAFGAAAIRISMTLGMSHVMDVPLWQYADGMSLYQDVDSNPLTSLDPSGMANTQPGSHGGICYLPCPKNHDRLMCMANCIEQNDPLNLLGKGLLTGLGGPIPKSILDALGVRVTTFGGGASRLTTPPSLLSSEIGAGARSGLRMVGRVSFWAWLAYADYLAGVETACLGACTGDPCAY